MFNRTARQRCLAVVLAGSTRLVAYVTSSFARTTRTSGPRMINTWPMSHLHTHPMMGSVRDSSPAIRSHPCRTAPRIIIRATLESSIHQTLGVNAPKTISIHPRLKELAYLQLPLISMASGTFQWVRDAASVKSKPRNSGLTVTHRTS
jgi:hypothetical protein